MYLQELAIGCTAVIPILLVKALAVNELAIMNDPPARGLVANQIQHPNRSKTDPGVR